MPSCEICGKYVEIARKISTDGCTMLVCEGCSSFGKIIEERSAPKVSRATEPRAFQRIKQPRGIDSFDAGDTLAKGFGKIIQRARQKKEWTAEELGKKVFEKASTLHRIESQQLKPGRVRI